MPGSSRRRFLFASAGLGALASAGGVAWWLSRELQAVSRRSFALGTQVTITALHVSPTVSDQAIAAAFAEIETVEHVMSIYRPESELSRLNRMGRIESPHPYLVQVLRHAAAISRDSGGAFDATVQPLWKLYADAHRAGWLPAEAEVDAARRKVDWRQIEISPDRITLRGEGTAITLNGIAQGFAADRAMAALREQGVEHALVDAGELSPLGYKSNGSAWTAGIQHPREKDAYLALARLEGRCLATSGDYATSFSPDHKYNHLFDPRTGYSPVELSSVSIAAPTAIQADALSTAVFVLGIEGGLRLIGRLPDVDALLVYKDGCTRAATAGFPAEV